MKSSQKRWFTPEEDAFLLENVGKLSYSQIARELGRLPSTVYNRYRKLVVGDVCENRRQWTPEEDELVREMLLNGHSYADIAKRLGRTENAVSLRAGFLGLRHSKRYTRKEENYIRDHWGKVPPSRIAKRLGRTVGAIQKKAYNMGLPCDGERCPYFTPRELAEAIGLDPRTVRRLCEKGVIPAKRLYLGEKPEWFITADDAEKWCRENPGRWRAATHANKLWKALVNKRFWDEARYWAQDGSWVKTRKRRTIPEHLRPAFAKFVARVAEEWRAKRGYDDPRPEWVRQLASGDNSMAKRQKKRWTAEEDRILREMFRRGATYKEIAERLNRTEWGVFYRINEAGAIRNCNSLQIAN